MAEYRIKLTPDLINLHGEGSQDTAVMDGVSIQRTAYLDVEETGKRKIATGVDGTIFDNHFGYWGDNVNVIPLSIPNVTGLELEADGNEVTVSWDSSSRYKTEIQYRLDDGGWVTLPLIGTGVDEY